MITYLGGKEKQQLDSKINSLILNSVIVIREEERLKVEYTKQKCLNIFLLIL